MTTVTFNFPNREAPPYPAIAIDYAEGEYGDEGDMVLAARGSTKIGNRTACTISLLPDDFSEWTDEDELLEAMRDSIERDLIGPGTWFKEFNGS